MEPIGDLAPSAAHETQGRASLAIAEWCPEAASRRAMTLHFDKLGSLPLTLARGRLTYGRNNNLAAIDHSARAPASTHTRWRSI
jgi:hypothetical protein